MTTFISRTFAVVQICRCLYFSSLQLNKPVSRNNYNLYLLDLIYRFNGSEYQSPYTSAWYFRPEPIIFNGSDTEPNFMQGPEISWLVRPTKYQLLLRNPSNLSICFNSKPTQPSWPRSWSSHTLLLSSATSLVLDRLSVQAHTVSNLMLHFLRSSTRLLLWSLNFSSYKYHWRYDSTTFNWFSYQLNRNHHGFILQFGFRIVGHRNGLLHHSLLALS